MSSSREVLCGYLFIDLDLLIRLFYCLMTLPNSSTAAFEGAQTKILGLVRLYAFAIGASASSSLKEKLSGLAGYSLSAWIYIDKYSKASVRVECGNLSVQFITKIYKMMLINDLISL